LGISRRRVLRAFGEGAGLVLLGGRLPLARASAQVSEKLAVPAAADLAPDPTDPIAILYGRRLAFADGAPLVTVRVMEGQQRFTFIPNGPVRVGSRGQDLRVVGPKGGGRWTVRVAESRPGRSVARVHVGEHLFNEGPMAEADAQLFRDHGYKPSLVSVGTVYGIAGRTVDTRHVLILLEGDGSEETAAKLVSEVGDRFSARPAVHREPLERGHGTVEVISPAGVVVAHANDALAIDVEGGLTVERVEHSMGYPDHGFEDRSYSGRLFAVVDSHGLLAAVNLVPLEQLAKGIVPSEIFARAHPESLKAQAVTARGEILAKVGARHVGDPYLLCAEQHCQVFRGQSGEDPRTSAAVDATRGEALFAANGGPLVPSYYSAICGGHTEDNDMVWGGPPNPSIRGRPDFPLNESTQAFSEGIGEALLRSWLVSKVPAYCRTASTAKPDKYRWKRVFAQAEVDGLAAAYGVGHVASLDIDGRGISGRARTLVLRGAAGEARVHSELSIRRLFKMLPSGMFVVDAEGRGRSRRFVFQGGGWGHGAGMCQTGAIGRAEQGASYRDILRVYFSGADVVRMYG
jgi:stage II sporulation protein D